MLSVFNVYFNLVEFSVALVLLDIVAAAIVINFFPDLLPILGVLLTIQYPLVLLYEVTFL